MEAVNVREKMSSKQDVAENWSVFQLLRQNCTT